MATVKVTSKGQITIPAHIRHEMRLIAGDKLELVWMDDGSYTLVPLTYSVKDLKGIVPSIGKQVTLEDMQEAIIAGSLGQELTPNEFTAEILEKSDKDEDLHYFDSAEAMFNNLNI